MTATRKYQISQIAGDHEDRPQEHGVVSGQSLWHYIEPAECFCCVDSVKRLPEIKVKDVNLRYTLAEM